VVIFHLWYNNINYFLQTYINYFIQKEVSNYLEYITKQEKLLLIEHGILVQVGGSYGENLVTINKNKTYKKWLVPDPIYFALLSLKHRLKKQEIQQQIKVDK